MPVKSVAVVSAYRSGTGSTSVALSYQEALVANGRTTRWYQCVSAGPDSAYILGDRPLRGIGLGMGRASILLNALSAFPLMVRRLPEDVLFLTDPILLGAAEKRRESVVVVHDIRELTTHRWNPLTQMGFRYLFHRLSEASLIIADSETTREDLRSGYPIDIPVEVVHPPSRLRGDAVRHIPRSVETVQGAGRVNVLYVAADRRYKNVGFFIDLADRIFRSAASARFRFTLVSDLSPPHRARVRALALPNLTVRSYVDEITTTYEDADVLLFPSAMEGFGLPLVEAMQFGIPLLAHDASTIPEVTGDAAMLLPDLDLGRWTGALLGLLDGSTYERLATRSRERGEAFTPESFAARVAPVIDRYF